MQRSVAWLYCIIDSVSHTLRMEWKKDGFKIVEDIFHIRTRKVKSSTLGRTSLILIVDYFQASDGGSYQCFAENNGRIVRGSALNLTGTVV